MTPEDEVRGAAAPGREACPGPGVDRRSFLQLVGGGVAGALALGSGVGAPSEAEAYGLDQPLAPPVQNRRHASYRTRLKAAQMAKRRPLVHHATNGEEQDYPFIASYSKGLPHDALGEVDAAAYQGLLDCLRHPDPDKFEQIQLGLGRKLTSPEAGLAFDLQGPDSHHETIRPAPRIDSPENSAEMAELYWMALARDVPFGDYETDPLTSTAAADLSRFSDFRGPKQRSAVTPATLFRGSTPGDLAGPYLSQFLWLEIPYGPQTLHQRNLTVLPGIDFLTRYDAWLASQNGDERAIGTDALDSTARYIRNLRDLAAWVHIDALYQAYLNACLILLGLGCPPNPGNPLVGSATEGGFAEWGGPHILALVTEVSTRALKAVWYQKWFVHRRIRPEAMGGLIQNHVTGAARYPIDPEILGSPVLDEVVARHGTYLLPQVYPEGSPTHPSYGAGHATVAGACVTILKAWFDTERFVIPEPVVASSDGTALLPYVGAPLTALGELDKVAANIAQGRNAAGIHWRSDYWESVNLGERVAIGILQEQNLCHNRQASFTFRRFDGSTASL